MVGGGVFLQVAQMMRAILDRRVLLKVVLMTFKCTRLLALSRLHWIH